MRYLTAISSAPVFLLPLLSGDVARAQLLGCDAVNCPVDTYRTAQCQVGNATLKALGIANVTTIADPRPLSWTLGLQENGGQTDSTFDRNFYLGTPPSFTLDNTTGCALFFEGIAANLTISDPRKTGNFTCSNVLNQNCVSNLILQTQDAANGLGGTDFCNSLRDALVNEPPPTCSSIQGSWGKIAIRSLTGDGALQKADQSRCRVTTAQGYDVSLVNSQRQQPTSREMEEINTIVNAITPVMTVFRKGNTTGPDLTCLKLVESTANQTTDSKSSDSASTGAASSKTSLSFIAHLFLISLMFSVGF